MLQFVLQFLNHLLDQEIAERNSAEAILTIRDRIEDCRVRTRGPVASGTQTVPAIAAGPTARRRGVDEGDGEGKCGDSGAGNTAAPLHWRVGRRGRAPGRARRPERARPRVARCRRRSPCSRATTAAPLGRGPDLNMALDLNVAASSQVTLAAPRLVVRTSPPSATAPATPGNPGSVAICFCAS